MLYIMRHGEAIPSEENWLRPLTEEGKADIAKAAKFIKNTDPLITTIYHSDKIRTQQTAEIVANTLSNNQEMRHLPALDPEQNVTNLCQAITFLPGNIMLVGHLPNIELLCNFLLHGSLEGHSVAFSPGTVACLIREGTDWSIQWVVNPFLF